MDKISRLYFKSCKELNLNPVKMPEIDGFRFILGKQLYYFRSGQTPFNNASACSISSNKFSTNLVLHNHQIPVPKAFGITYKEFKKGLLDLSDMHFPVVIKPNWGSCSGIDVICNIESLDALLEILPPHLKKHHSMSIEEFQGGLRSYRVLVFAGCVIGLVERIPAHVVGDGQHTITQLIDLENEKRRLLRKKLPYGQLKLNIESEFIFKKQGINSDYVPQLDEKIPLRYICNSAAGGTTISLPINDICEENKLMAIKAAKVLDLDLVGFDFLCEDISQPIGKTRGFIIEANYAPDITLHELSPAGTPTQVTRIILKKFISQNRFAYLLHRLQSKTISFALKFLLVLAVILLAGHPYILKELSSFTPSNLNGSSFFVDSNVGK